MRERTTINFILAAFLAVSFFIPFTIFSKTVKRKKNSIKRVVRVKSEKKFKGLEVNGKLVLGTQIADSKQIESRIFNLSLLVSSSQKIDDNLFVLADINISMESGSNRSIYVDEFAAKSGFELQEAVIRYGVKESFIKIGSIGQAVYDNPLLVTEGSSFPGLYERVQFGESFALYFSGEQAIPNNQMLSSRIGNVEEGTPTFIEGRVGLKGSEFFDFNIYGGIYKFNSLSSGVAHESSLLGNSCVGNSPASTHFLYEFEGVEAGLKIGLNNFSIQADYLKNRLAPTGRNQAYIMMGRLSFDLLSFTGGIFSSESDVTPAYYNSKWLGHSNKEGIILGMEAEKILGDFDLEINYTDAKEINTSVYRSDLRTISFKIMRSYDFY